MELLSKLFKYEDLRKKLFFTFFILLVYKIGTHIPISGINVLELEKLFQNGGVLGFFNLFSGGGLSRFSLFALGILPYINASIIMQLSMIIWPSLKEIAEEGESGRKQLAQYTRYLTVFIALIQSILMSFGFKSLILPDVSFLSFLFYSSIFLIAGAMLVMWFGELISEYGIGNGASLLIFVGIVAQMPRYFMDTYVLVVGGLSIFRVLIMILIILFMVVAIIYVQEAQRKIPVQYAKRVVGRKMYSGQNTYIPLKLVQGGVMPIIFTSAVLQFPAMFAHYSHIPWLSSFFTKYYAYDGFLYNFIFCLLIFFFSYFYTAVTFNPQELSDNIKKHGGFITGIRPGKPTVDFLEGVVTKLTLVGAIFLSMVALAPVIASNITQVTSFKGLGGTALLIIVGVALDLLRQIEAYIVSKKYEGFVQ